MILEIGIFMFLIKAKFLLRLIDFFTLCYWTDHTILLLMLQVNQSIYEKKNINVDKHFHYFY